jgi:hypothetical protein
MASVNASSFDVYDIYIHVQFERRTTSSQYVIEDKELAE